MNGFRLTFRLFLYGFAVSFFVHGAVRFPKLAQFAEGMSQRFEGTLLAGWPSLSFAYLIPFLECASAVLLMLPSRKWSLKGAQLGVLTMSGIMIGTCLIEQWNLLTSQLLHTLVFLVIAFFIDNDPVKNEPTKGV